MASSHAQDYDMVLRIVRQWPAAQRFGLVQDVLKTLEPVEPAEVMHTPTLSRARGLLSSDQAAPTDAEIADWLDAHRRERYDV